MEYQKFGNTLIVRLDRGEEVVDRLLELARREHITLASVNGLGAADDVTVGVYFPATQEYKSNQFQGEYEIISLHGTLTTQEDQPYGHFHMSIGDAGGPGLRRAPEPGRHQRHLRAGGHPSGGPGGAEDGPGNRPQPHGV